MKTIGYAAIEPHGKLKEFEYDLGPIGDHQVDVKVETCGICQSDVSIRVQCRSMVSPTRK